jgi:type II secretory pathway component PulJ
MPSVKFRRGSAGISLVELMVGIAVGLVVLVGLSSVYVNSVRGGRTTTASNQLNQELRALMDIMVNDLRRTGHWSTAAAGVANPFMALTTQPAINGGNCILYSYDATFAGITPGVPGPEDRFGFRLNTGGVVQAVQPGTLASTATPCANANWEPLTDELSTQVTQLTFDTAGSKCIAFIPGNYVPTDSTTYTQWTTASGNGPACDPGASNAPSPYPDTTTHHFVETRQVNITLAGQSRTDPTLPAVTLNEAVLIRANRVITP